MMIGNFKQYCPLDPNVLKSMFETDAIFVFDTNVLLDFFRLPGDIVEKILSILQRYKERIRIPYHVEEEFHSHALEMIAKQVSGLEDEIRAIETSLTLPECIKLISIQSYQDCEKAIQTARTFVLNDLKGLVSSLTNQQSLHDKYSKVMSFFDGIQLKAIDDVHKALLTSAAKERYERKIAPGFKDKKKEENFEGDYIIWWEILNLVNQEKKSIILVSDDWKEDWMVKIHDKIYGPLPSLRAEIYEQNETSELHIYNFKRFLDFADTENVLSADDKSLINKRKQLYVDLKNIAKSSSVKEDSFAIKDEGNGTDIKDKDARDGKAKAIEKPAL